MLESSSHGIQTLERPQRVAASPTSIDSSRREFLRASFVGLLSLSLNSCRSNNENDLTPTALKSPADSPLSPKELSELQGSILGQPFILTIKTKEGGEEKIQVKCTTRDGIPHIEAKGRKFVCTKIGSISLPGTNLIGEADVKASPGVLILESSTWGSFTMSEGEFRSGMSQLVDVKSDPTVAFPVTVTGEIDANGVSYFFVSNAPEKRTAYFQEEMEKP